MTKIDKNAKSCQAAAGAVDGANPNPNWGPTELAASYELAPNSRHTAHHISPTKLLKLVWKGAENTQMHHFQQKNFFNKNISKYALGVSFRVTQFLGGWTTLL